MQAEVAIEKELRVKQRQRSFFKAVRGHTLCVRWIHAQMLKRGDSMSRGGQEEECVGEADTRG